MMRPLEERRLRASRPRSPVVSTSLLLLALGSVSWLLQGLSPTTSTSLFQPSSSCFTKTSSTGEEELANENTAESEIREDLSSTNDTLLAAEESTGRAASDKADIDEHSASQQNNATLDLAIAPRAFSVWNKPFPCFPTNENWSTQSHQNTPTKTGFVFLKPYKTGSSTTAGIALRIARNVGLRQEMDYDMCDARFDHGPYTPFTARTMVQDRLTDQSFLWTVIRDPTTRAVSMFFHMQVSRQKVEPNFANFKKFLTMPQEESNPREDYYLKMLWTQGEFGRNQHDPYQTGRAILDDFDFIGVTERMDESAVALKMILNLPMADVLYLSAKSKGGYDAGGGGTGHCTYIWPSFLTPKMKEFLESELWQEAIKYDLEFYKTVNASLDKTIDALGREAFEQELEVFRKAQQQVKDSCFADTVFPCDQEGRKHKETDCLWLDSGCGTTCVDQVATDLNLW